MDNSKAVHAAGPWEIVEHSWSDTGIYAGGARIALLSIEDYATEENQEQLEAKMAANARLIAAAPDLLAALIGLTTNPHLDLGDLVYGVRETEGEGWDGPSVTAWSNAVTASRAAIVAAKESQP